MRHKPLGTVTSWAWRWRGRDVLVSRRREGHPIGTAQDEIPTSLFAVHVLACYARLRASHRHAVDNTSPSSLVSAHHGATASTHRRRVGVEGPVDMVGAPRVRAGPPHHRISYTAEKEAHSAAQRFPRQHTYTHEGPDSALPCQTDLWQLVAYYRPQNLGRTEAHEKSLKPSTRPRQDDAANLACYKASSQPGEWLTFYQVSEVV